MKPACVFLTLLLVGCGKESSPPIAATPPVAQPAASPSPATPVAAPPSATIPPPPASALGTSDNDKGTGRAELMELKRISGGMLMLRMALVNTSSAPMSLATEYTDSNTGDVYSVSGVTLIDPVNKKKYFVVRDAAGHCVCSEGLKDLKPGDRAMAWARFPAPPEDLQKISVMIPHFSPIDEIAITK